VDEDKAVTFIRKILLNGCNPLKYLLEFDEFLSDLGFNAG
jgi:hypothetical protein